MFLMEFNEIVKNPMFMLGVLVTMALVILAVIIGLWLVKNEGKFNNVVEITEYDWDLAKMFVYNPDVREEIERAREEYLAEYGLPKFKRIIITFELLDEIEYPLYLAIEKTAQPKDWNVIYYSDIKRVKVEVPLF